MTLNKDIDGRTFLMFCCLLNNPLNLNFMFGALNAGLTGTPSMSGFKSKGEALKYAIEFATQWKDGEKTINYPAAEELYNFICKHVELPETFDDGLSSLFQKAREYVEEEKRNKETLEKIDCACYKAESDPEVAKDEPVCLGMG